MTAPLWHLDWLRDRYGIRHIRIPRLQLFWRERRRPVAAPHHPQVKPVPQKRLTRARPPCHLVPFLPILSSLSLTKPNVHR